MPSTESGSDRVALVTGAARGIGAATVAALADGGWSVVAVDSCTDDPRLGYALGSAEELDALAAAAPERVDAVRADVRDVDALRGAAVAAVERFGRLDAAVACAGVVDGGAPAWETGVDTWQVQLEVNLTGVWNTARATIPTILARPTSKVSNGHGTFIAVSSAAGTTGLPLLSAYAASKHGVVGLVRSMAAELGPHDVTANVICPGSTRTPILDASAAVYGLASPDDFATHHLLERLVEPDEVASMIAYLCSDAGAAITGAVLPVDAGMSAHT